MAVFLINFFLMCFYISLSIVCTIIIHEVGHMLGGLISGYSFVYIKFLGLKLQKDYYGINICKCEKTPIGQCIMSPGTIDMKPYALILGGSVINILMGGIVLIISFWCIQIESIFLSISNKFIGISFFLYFFSVVSIILGFYNLFGKSYELDGNTFREVSSDKKSKYAYNSIMQISADFCKGKTWGSFDKSLFIANSTRTSLLAELTLYSCINEIEKITVAKDFNTGLKSVKTRLEILNRCKYLNIQKEAKKYIKKLNDSFFIRNDKIGTS